MGIVRLHVKGAAYMDYHGADIVSNDSVENDIRLISSIGWAGNDAAAEYINNRWNAVLNEIQKQKNK
jgi:hypothetical protein